MDETTLQFYRRNAQSSSQRLGHPVEAMRFDQLDAQQAYDGVWASASLAGSDLRKRRFVDHADVGDVCDPEL